MQDIIRRFFDSHDDWQEFPKFNAIQLNDTHPAITIAELMRLLVDENKMEWGVAGEITRASCNIPIIPSPEALERWSVDLLGRKLPRHLEIIFEINRRFIEDEVEPNGRGRCQENGTFAG